MNYWLAVMFLGCVLLVIRHLAWPHVDAGEDTNIADGSAWRLLVRAPVETMYTLTLVAFSTYVGLAVWLALITPDGASTTHADWLLRNAERLTKIGENIGIAWSGALVVLAAAAVAALTWDNVRRRRAMADLHGLEEELRAAAGANATPEKAGRQIERLAARVRAAGRAVPNTRFNRMWSTFLRGTSLAEATGIRRGLAIATSAAFALSLVQLQAGPVGRALALEALRIDLTHASDRDSSFGLPRKPAESTPPVPISDGDYARAADRIAGDIVRAIPPEHDRRYAAILHHIVHGPSASAQRTGATEPRPVPTTGHSDAALVSTIGAPVRTRLSLKVERDLRSCGAACGAWVRQRASDADPEFRPIADSLADVMIAPVEETLGALVGNRVAARVVRDMLASEVGTLFERLYSNRVTDAVSVMTTPPEPVRSAAVEPRVKNARRTDFSIPRMPSLADDLTAGIREEPLDLFGGDFTIARPGQRIELIGRDGCSRTAELRTFLKSRGVHYSYRNVDLDPMAARKVDAMVSAGRSTGLLPLLFVDGTFRSLEGTADENTVMLNKICPIR